MQNKNLTLEEPVVFLWGLQEQSQYSWEGFLSGQNLPLSVVPLKIQPQAFGVLPGEAAGKVAQE